MVGADYFFITGDGMKKRNELSFERTPEGEEGLTAARSKGEEIKCLIIRCFSSKNLFSHVVPVKGADEEDYAANLVMAAVLWLGHLKVIMRGDNEPALQALIERSMHIIRATVMDGSTETSR